jgi:hypothetical protein
MFNMVARDYMTALTLVCIRRQPDILASMDCLDKLKQEQWRGSGVAVG